MEAGVTVTDAKTQPAYPRIDRDELTRRLKEIADKKRLDPAESAQRLEDALERTAKLDFRLSPADKDRWAEYAEANGMTVSELIRDSVNERVGAPA